MYQPVVLVTGCSSGVGLALAELLYDIPHYRIVATSRVESLHILKNRFKESDRFIIRQLDVTSAKEREDLMAEIGELWSGVNILVNNAGISYRSVVEHMTDTDEEIQFATNYFGPVSLTRSVLPYMRILGRGKIINVSSVSGMVAMPTMSSYSASKYALEGFSEALWYEVKPLGIDVSLIQPGFINSKSFEKVRYSEKSRPGSPMFDGLYADYYNNMTPFITKLMKASLTTPQQVARQILKVIRTENPPLWIAATPDAWFFYYLRRMIPRRLLMPLLFRMLPNAKNWGRGYSNRRGS